MRTETKWSNVLLLSTTQALFQTSSLIVMTLSGIVGFNLAANKNLATLPIAIITLGTAIMMIPASFLIKKFGQKQGFIIGTGFGIIAGLLSFYGILNQSLALFSAGNMLIGCYQGFTQYYRFAAADSVPEASKGRAIAFVLSGGIVAAIAGPNLARYTQDIGNVPFAYSYLSISVLSVIASSILFGLKAQQPKKSMTAEKNEASRPLIEIIKQKEVITALASSAIGNSVMAMVMTATPLAMYVYGHTTDDSATVIQWHVLGMFIPSFFTGALIDKFGGRKIILTGIFILSIHIVLTLLGTELVHFISGLILVGIGWNFMFIGGSTMLTRNYRPPEKEKTQAFHDFLVFAVTGVSSFLAGGLLNYSGWGAVNLALIPLLLFALIILVVFYKHRITNDDSI